MKDIKEQINANIKSLEWIKFNIPDEGNNTFGHAVHLYVNNSIYLLNKFKENIVNSKEKAE